MNASQCPIQIADGFIDHPKTCQLHELAGPEAVIALMRLRVWAGFHRPSFFFDAASDADIAKMADWSGDAEMYIASLIASGWIAGNPGERRFTAQARGLLG
jgi:hypothetical protein